MVPEGIRNQFEEAFGATAEAGLIEIGEKNIKMTPLGAQCLDELLTYLEFHPRADVAKRSKRLREAMHKPLENDHG